MDLQGYSLAGVWPCKQSHITRFASQAKNRRHLGWRGGYTRFRIVWLPGWPVPELGRLHQRANHLHIFAIRRFESPEKACIRISCGDASESASARFSHVNGLHTQQLLGVQVQGPELAGTVRLCIPFPPGQTPSKRRYGLAECHSKGLGKSSSKAIQTDVLKRSVGKKRAVTQ